MNTKQRSRRIKSDEFRHIRTVVPANLHDEIRREAITHKLTLDRIYPLLIEKGLLSLRVEEGEQPAA